MKVKVGSVLIGVTDLEDAKEFYTKVFNLKVEDYRPPFMQAMLGDTEFNIEEDADYRDKDWADENIGGRKSVTFEVDDIFEFFKRAKKYGAEVVKEPEMKPWSWYEGIISDPDENEFVIEQEVGNSD